MKIRKPDLDSTLAINKALIRENQTLQKENERLKDQLESAWGIIANANEGDWDKALPTCKEAAERWRDL